MVTVYRLELPTGEGVYRHTALEKSVWARVTGNFFDESVHRPPSKDRLLRYDEFFDRQWVFGFISIEQYHHWVFNPYWRREFTRLGALLRGYEVKTEHLRKGLEQVIFLKENAKQIHTFSPSHFG